MQLEGTLKKMKAEKSNPIEYFLDLGEDFISVNQLIGKSLNIQHKGFCCSNCGSTEPIKGSGLCKECYYIVPQTHESIIRPEKSTAHLGIEARDLEWEKKYQLQPHIVYLANSSGLKVGVTREKQSITRWIDQGAKETIVLAKTDNRYEAGMVEVALSEHISDKTNYRKMLTSNPEPVDLLVKKDELSAFVPEAFRNFISAENSITSINYPIDNYPEKIKSIKLEKTNIENFVLKGIKGQYLIFENGEVFNVRSHEGFVVTLNFN